jgi:hypothetical protein
MKCFTTLVFTIVCSLSAFAQRGEYLEPVGGIFDIYSFEFEYHSKIRDILFKGLSDEPEVRFVGLPSFVQEYVFEIQQDEKTKKYFAVYQEVDSMIWFNERPDRIQVRTLKKEIRKESVDLIKQLFLSAIKLTRHPNNEPHGFDGTNYYFSAQQDGIVSGKTWSPPDGSKLRRLTNISIELIALTCGSVSPILITGELRKEITKLTTEFK